MFSYIMSLFGGRVKETVDNNGIEQDMRLQALSRNKYQAELSNFKQDRGPRVSAPCCPVIPKKKVDAYRSEDHRSNDDDSFVSGVTTAVIVSSVFDNSSSSDSFSSDSSSSDSWSGGGGDSSGGGSSDSW